MATRSVLISGAGVAGPAAAFWLNRYGYDVTVVERAPQLRAGGQNVDIRGQGRQVLQRMALEDAVLERNTGEQGTRFVAADGTAVATFGVDGDAGPTAELEILRSDLVELLYEQTRERTDYRFGTTISAVDDDGSRARVTFADDTTGDYDVVVLAEGMRSAGRDLLFPADEVRLRRLGAYTAWLTIPRTAADDDWWRWYSAGEHRVATLRPDNHGSIRATLSFLSDEPDLERRDSPAQLAILQRVFADAGWEVPRILEGALDGDSSSAVLYFEALAQVRAERWSTGRVVLLGDTAAAPSPVAGFGTSLALIGAYVLAGELAATDDVPAALRTYEHIVRPIAERAQQLPPGTPRLAHPGSRAAVAVFNTAVRAAASPLVQGLAGRLGGAGRTRNVAPLPRYVPVPAG